MSAWRQRLCKRRHRDANAAAATWTFGTCVQRVLMIALLAICVASDAFLAQQRFLKDASLVRHLADSSAHGAVAFCCWGIFLCQTNATRRSSSPLPDVTNNDTIEQLLHGHNSIEWRAFIRQCAFAGIAASLLDIDHFIAARAFSIDGATHLMHRPFGHAVTFIVAVALVVAVCSTVQTRATRVSFVVVALLSHQLRDGMRLGLWCWPFGSTPPIPYGLYLALEEALPFTMAVWVNRVGGCRSSTESAGFESVALDDVDAHDVQVHVVVAT